MSRGSIYGLNPTTVRFLSRVNVFDRRVPGPIVAGAFADAAWSPRAERARIDDGFEIRVCTERFPRREVYQLVSTNCTGAVVVLMEVKNRVKFSTTGRFRQTVFMDRYRMETEKKLSFFSKLANFREKTLDDNTDVCKKHLVVFIIIIILF